MEKIIFASIGITVLFLVVKYVEKTVIKKHQQLDDPDDPLAPKPPLMKDAFRDAILVFICSLVSLVAVDQLWPFLNATVSGLATGEIIDMGPPQVFDGSPDF